MIEPSYIDPIYIKSHVAQDDFFCNKSKELMDEVDHCIATLKTNPDGRYETIALKREDNFAMKVSFYGQHSNAYVYVSEGDVYQGDESMSFDVSNGCGELHDHVARVLAQHKQ
jgi:hypothetical protein